MTRISHIYCEYWQCVQEEESTHLRLHTDGLVQERLNSSALAMELRLSCTNPSVYDI